MPDIGTYRAGWACDASAPLFKPHRSGVPSGSDCIAIQNAGSRADNRWLVARWLPSFCAVWSVPGSLSSSRRWVTRAGGSPAPATTRGPIPSDLAKGLRAAIATDPATAQYPASMIRDRRPSCSPDMGTNLPSTDRRVRTISNISASALDRHFQDRVRSASSLRFESQPPVLRRSPVDSSCANPRSLPPGLRCERGP